MGVRGAASSCGDMLAFPGSWDCPCRYPTGGDMTPHTWASAHASTEVKAARGPRWILGDRWVCSQPPRLHRAWVLRQHHKAPQRLGAVEVFLVFSPFPMCLVPWGAV